MHHVWPPTLPTAVHAPPGHSALHAPLPSVSRQPNATLGGPTWANTSSKHQGIYIDGGAVHRHISGRHRPHLPASGDVGLCMHTEATRTTHIAYWRTSVRPSYAMLSNKEKEDALMPLGLLGAQTCIALVSSLLSASDRGCSPACATMHTL